MESKELKFTLNGKPYELSVKPWRTLLELIREDLKSTGTKEGKSRYLHKGDSDSNCGRFGLDRHTVDTYGRRRTGNRIGRPGQDRWPSDRANTVAGGDCERIISGSGIVFFDGGGPTRRKRRCGPRKRGNHGNLS